VDSNIPEERSQVGVDAAPSPPALQEQLESLDPFRGYTLAGMRLVSFLGSFSWVTEAFPNLKHHNTCQLFRLIFRRNFEKR